MRFFKVLTSIFIVSFFVACNFTEEIYFNEDGKLLPMKTIKTKGILPQKAKFNKFALPTERLQMGENIGQLLSKYN